MKYLFLFTVVLFNFSCKLPKFRIVESESPYITLKKGTVIPCDMVELQKGKKEDNKLIANNNVYLPKTVAYYSDGISTFGSIQDSLFAKKVVSGKISLFTNNLNSYGKPASSKPFYYYAQKNPILELKQFSYYTLNRMIEPNHAAQLYLKRYNKINLISIIAGSLGLGASAVGFYQILQDKGGHPGFAPGGGVYLTAIGVWSFLTCAIVNDENKVNLFKAVKAYDTE